LLAKDKDVNGSKAAASIIIKDVIELLIVLGSLVVGIVLLALNYEVNSLVLLVIGVAMFFLALPLVAILYLSLKINAAEKLRIIKGIWVKVRGKKASTVALQKRVHNQIVEFRDGVMIMQNNPRAIVRPIIFQTFAWVFEVFSFFFVFAAIGSLIGIDMVLITNTVVINVRGQGIALAGISQIVSSELYKVLGITPGIAIASSLLAGFSGFWFKLVLSFAFFQVTVFERYISFFCSKCSGWRAWRIKTCPEPKPKKQRRWFNRYQGT